MLSELVPASVVVEVTNYGGRRQGGTVATGVLRANFADFNPLGRALPGPSTPPAGGGPGSSPSPSPRRSC